MNHSRALMVVLVVLLLGTIGCGSASDSAGEPRQGAGRVEFVVTGGAPNGVEIVYGSDESHRRGTLPLDVTEPLAKHVTYYVSAQLHGGGHVVCKVIIGNAVRTGHAIGGFDTCTAQSPSDSLGGWH